MIANNKNSLKGNNAFPDNLESQNIVKKRKREMNISNNSELDKKKNIQKNSLLPQNDGKNQKNNKIVEENKTQKIYKKPNSSNKNKSLKEANEKEKIENMILNELNSLELDPPSGIVAIQTRIMLHLKERHFQGNIHPISIHEIMMEINETFDGSMINYLEKEYFHHNLKIEVENGKYKFKPLYDIKSSDDLLRLVTGQFENGEKNILLSDVMESCKKGEIFVRKLEKRNKIIRIKRKRDQNDILMVNNTFSFDDLTDCSSFIKVFHSIDISGLVPECMEKDIGVQPMKSESLNTKTLYKKPLVTRKKVKRAIRTNVGLEHLFM